MEEIRHIYLEKYPSYVENLTKIPYVDIVGFKQKLLESYNKCLKVAQKESSLNIQIDTKKSKIRRQ